MARRRALVPEITYPEDLPVVERRDDIAAAIRDHQVVVVAGETGSGKTTQIPKICLELGRGIEGTIGHTQPRRIAARSVAERIAEELDAELGAARRLPGPLHRPLQQRHAGQGDDRRHPAGRDAARPRPAPLRHDHHRRGARAQPQHRLPARLPQAAAAAPARPQADHHLGDDRPRAVRRALRRRHGAPAPIIEVSGRTYPVEVRYRPLGEAATPSDDRDQVTGIVRGRRGAVDRALRRQRHPRLPLRRARDPRRRRRPRAACSCPPPRCCRCTAGCPPPSSTASSAGTPGGGSCWPPTSPRPR